MLSNLGYHFVTQSVGYGQCWVATVSGELLRAGLVRSSLINECLKALCAGDGPGTALWGPAAKTMEAASKDIIAYTAAVADPFNDDYAWENPWLNKKDSKNKGKKPKPATEKSRPIQDGSKAK